MAIAWGNIGEFMGLIAIMDSRTITLDFTFSPPPIMSLDIDQSKKIITANTKTGVTICYHYQVGLTSGKQRNNSSQLITALIPVQNENIVILLSGKNVEIYDMISQELILMRQMHPDIVEGMIYISQSGLLFTYTKADSNNLLVWNDILKN